MLLVYALPVRVDIAVAVIISLLDNRVAFQLKIRDFSWLHQPRPEDGRIAEINHPTQWSNLEGGDGCFKGDR